MNNALRFRRATLADAEGLSQLVNSAYRGDSSRRGWTTEADLLDGQRTDPAFLRELINHPNTVIFVAEQSAAGAAPIEMIGSVQLEKIAGAGCYLGMFTVRPDLQGLGIGKIFMSEAETWIRDGGTTPERDRAAWEHQYAAWLDDFASRDVEGIGFGIVTLRRPTTGSPTLRRLEEQTGTVHQPLGATIAASLAAHDWLAARNDATLAAERLTVAGDVTEERYLTPGASDPSVVLLRQGGGFGRAVRAGTALAGFVGACDGSLTVGSLVAALGDVLDVPASDVAADVLPSVRGLVEDGLLLAV